MLKQSFAFLVFIFGLFQGIQAQSAVIDSLESELSRIQGCSAKTEKLQQISEGHLVRSKDDLLYFINKAIVHNKTCKDTIAWGKILLEKCVYFNELSMADSALVVVQQAERLFNEINYNEKKCYLLKQYAISYATKNDFAQAIENNLKALECFELTNDEFTPSNIRGIKLNIGICYSKLREPKKAEKYWMDLYSDSLQYIDKRLYTSLTINLCLNYRVLGRFEESIKFGLLAADATDAPQTLSKVYGNLGTAYGASKQYDKSYDYMMKSLAIQKELKDSARMQQTYHNLGFLFKIQGKYDKAIKYYLSSNKELKRRGNLVVLRRSYHEISELYKAQKDYEKALTYLALENEIKDSILGLEKIKAISDSEAKYETEKNKRDKEKAESQTKIEKLKSRQNWNLFIFALALLGLILVSSFFYYSRLKAKKKIEMATLELKETQKRLELEKKTRVSQLTALKAQMNPHFIFNALNSIQDYILSNKSAKASDYLVKFSELIRNYLNFSDTGNISLEEEVNNLKLYLDLEKSRFGDKLEFSFELDSTILQDEVEIPTMIIQPYVENALVHGLFHKDGDQKLFIRFKQLEENVLQCEIEDNGVGRTSSAELNKHNRGKHKSFATKANSDRLDLFNESYENKLEVKIHDMYDGEKPIGTKVELRIPILNAMDE